MRLTEILILIISLFFMSKFPIFFRTPVPSFAIIALFKLVFQLIVIIITGIISLDEVYNPDQNDFFIAEDVIKDQKEPDNVNKSDYKWLDKTLCFYIVFIIWRNYHFYYFY